MEEWKEYRFTDVASLTNGRAYLQPELQSVGKYKIVRVGNLSGGDKWFYSDMELPQEKYCNKGDLLYAWACSFGPYIWEGDKTIYHYHIWKVDVNSAVADKMFLYYYLKYYTPKWMGFTNGSVMMHITKGSLEKQIVSLPSLPTQQKIAKILSSLDDKIEVNRRINEQLEELAQALFKSWFVDFEPFKDGEFVDSELGMIPKGWKVGKYTDMVDIRGGGTPKTDISEYWNGEIPFFTPKDVNNNVYCIETEKNITELGLSKCSSRLYSKNTVFITARGTVGKICMAGRDMAMNQTCYALLGKENYGQHFIYMQTINIVERMKKKANGAVFSAITTRDFDSEKIVIPSVEIVSDFLPKIKSIYESILRNQQETLHLTTLRDTLLPKLMSGEMDVNERGLERT